MNWQAVSAAEWVTALLCCSAGISCSQGKRGSHLLSHLKSRVKTFISKPGTSAPVGTMQSLLQEHILFLPWRVIFLGRLACSSQVPQAQNKPRGGTCHIFQPNSLPLCLSKCQISLSHLASVCLGSHFWYEEVNVARHLYYYVKYCSRLWEPSALTFTQEYWTNAHSLTGWISMRSYIKPNVLIMAEEAEI